MQVRSIRWVGVATDAYPAMSAFLTDVLGLQETFRDALTAEFRTGEGDAIQIMGRGDPYYDFFSREARGPVPLLEVDDVAAAGVELEAAGVEIVGEQGRDQHWTWIHFRAPDGNLYELASRLER
jgi:catechol 2,3-dioxygenase-like lactoylglutathione lyase family enzyme